MRTDENGSSQDGCYDPKYCENGHPKSTDELLKMRNKRGSGPPILTFPSGSSTGTLQFGPPVPPVVSYPSEKTLHILEGNVVSEVPIYNYSTNPPTIIGYKITSYAIDNWNQPDLTSFLPIPKRDDPISVASFIYSAGEKLLKPGLENLSTLGIVISCPECAIIAKIIFGVHDINEAITYNAHLRTHDVYFREPLWAIDFNHLFDIKPHGR